MAVHDEVEEHIHHAHNTFDKLVAGCMAVIAAALAIVSLLGQHFNTEKLLTQQKASDMWAYYQAKDIRRYTAVMAQDLLSAAKSDAAVVQRYAQDAARYKKQTQEEQAQAQDFEKERDRLGSEADAFHFGEVFLEVAIVLSSLAILMKRKLFFYAGVASAVIGAFISLAGYVRFGLNG
jgi:hypothetical protein